MKDCIYKCRYFIVFLFLILSSINAFCNMRMQDDEKIIKGVVYDENNEPAIGANIILEGTGNGTITDLDGCFSLKVSNTGILIVSYTGYKKETVKIGNKSFFKIYLKPDDVILSEVVVVGYGTQKKETVVGSVTQVNSDRIKERGVVTNVTDALSGSMPGVTVLTSSGLPGGGSETGFDKASSILIRGKNTWNNSSPLVLVDGIERDMNDLDINEIESFSVLKDASATAVFGVKGANGVILITTKRGEEGKAKVTFETNQSLKTVSHMSGPVDSYRGLIARNYAIVHELPIGGADAWNYYVPERILNKYLNNEDPEKYTNVDWFDFMTKNVAWSQKYNVTVSGGTKSVKYFTLLGYVFDDDILNTSNPNSKGVKPEFNYKRFNFRSNLDFKLSKTTNLSVNLSGYMGKQQMSAGNYPKIMAGVCNGNPNSPLPIYSDGIYGSDDPLTTADNAYKVLMSAGTKVFNRYSLKSDISLMQKLDFITKGLSFKGKFSFDNFYSTRGREVLDDQHYITKRWDDNLGEWVYVTPNTDSDYEFVPGDLEYKNEYINSQAANQTMRNIYYELGFTYNRKLGDHNIGALATMNRQYYVMGSSWPSKREDWVGRITYDYAGKYLFETNAAYNGSAKFGPNYRFDFFPSLAVGWRLSEENFIKNKVPQISNLKLKYSIGLVGNDNFTGMSMWPYMTTFINNPDKLARFGNGALTDTPYNSGFRESTPGNINLRWEIARKQDLGVEFDFFNGLISGAFDYFNEYRYDMLIGASDRIVPDYYGTVPSAVNLGEVISNGMEIEITLRKKFGDLFTWLSGNWTKAVNKIKYAEDPELKPAYQKKEGFAIGQTNSYVVNNIINSWDDLYCGVLYEQAYTNNSTLLPGDYRMIDYNSDGIINNQDIIPYGYSNYPQNTYGFSLGLEYKGFAFSCSFYGAYNVTLSAPERFEMSGNAPIVYEEILERTWTPEYKNENPTWRAFNYNRNTTKGTYLGSSTIYDASFLRLKTMELSYTFPKKWIPIESLRVYANGNNLFFWSDMPFDLEGNNFDYRNYPTTRVFNFGIQATF